MLSCHTSSSLDLLFCFSAVYYCMEKFMSDKDIVRRGQKKDLGIFGGHGMK